MDKQNNLKIYSKELFQFLFSHNWRITRLEFILWAILLLFLFLSLSLLSDYTFSVNYAEFLSTIFFLASYYSFYVLLIKRFHDINKSWWYIFVPFYNFIATLFFKWDKKENTFWIYLKNKYITLKFILILISFSFLTSTILALLLSDII